MNENRIRKQDLAKFGGTPARATPMPGPYPGALMIGDEERRLALEVLDSRSLFRYYGPDLRGMTVRLERDFAARMQVPHALAVRSGTASLKVALTALGVGPGDEVIVPSLTFVASIGAVVQVGAIPVFAEVDASLSMDPDDVEAKLTERTMAVMPVHVSGVACRMDRLTEIGRRHGVAILEDCAQSCGAAFGGRPVGSWGDVGAYSFQLNKTITAGEGGAVVARDPAVFERAIRYHDQGFLRGEWDEGQFFGENYRMNELSAAVLVAQLAKVDTIIGNMRALKERVVEGIRDLPLTLREVPDAAGDGANSVAFFLDSPAEAQRFVELLAAENVSCARPYSGRVAYLTWPQIGAKRTSDPKGFPFTSPHCRTDARYEAGLCPRSEDLVSRVVFVPMSPVLPADDADAIVAGIRKVARYVADTAPVAAGVG
jgi:8-amino-3,8-dideoxy-alpha-D-manno-octulosonate transaminase